MEIFEISLNNEKNYTGHTLSIEKNDTAATS
jgi:hypothetical protein